MPRTPLVLGTLAIVFAWLEIVYCALLLLFAILGRSASFRAGDLQRLAAQAAHASVAWFALVEPTPYLVMAIALLVIGVGLARGEPWSRRAATTWAWIALAVLAADVITVLGYVRPHMEAARAAFYASRGLPAPAAAPSARALTAALTLSQTAFVLTLLLLLRRRPS
jgi:hypothetical protein